MAILQKVNTKATIKKSTNADSAGGGGRGGINYIKASDAEGTLAGWNRYADAAGAAPVDGTGGSPASGMTFSRSSSSPLRGTNSFLLSKDAANRQGEGVSYDFEIDNADKAAVLSIEFDMETSTNYVEGDVVVYVYDVTNAVMIQAMPYKVPKGSGKFKSVFQTSYNSTSYRLILHVSTTSALAYSLKMDRVVVGPQVILQGTPVTDWQQYTMTPQGTSSNPTKGTTVVDKAMWRRVGDSMEIMYHYRQSGAGTAGSGTYLFHLPPGYTIDQTKLGTFGNDSAVVGSGLASNQNAAAFVQVFDATRVQIRYIPEGTGLASTFKSDGSITYGNAPMSFGIVFRVPIVGWSSQVAMSSDADTRVVAASYYLSANQSVNAAQINFDTKDFDTHGAVTTGVGSWKFTAPVQGIYQVELIYAISGSQGTDIELYKNGSLYRRLSTYTLNTAGYIHSGSTTIQLNAGDYIDVRPTGTVTVWGLAPSGNASTISIFRLSGPSAIAATETIACKYMGISGSVGASYNNIVFPTKSFDTHGAYNNSTGVFTAPVAGKYRVSVQSAVAMTDATGWTSLRIRVTQAGSKSETNYNYNVTSASNVNPTTVCSQINTVFDMKAGDTLSFADYADGGSPSRSGTESYLSIERIGI